MGRAIVGLLALLLIGCSKQSSDSPSDLEESFKIEKAGAEDGALIAAFTAQASSGDIDSLLEKLDPEAVRRQGQSAVRQFLRTELLPFFADVTAVDTYETISKAALPDGRVGRMHYTYVKTNAGTLKPITVAVVGTGNSLRVAYIGVGECVPDRHPKSEGRCR